MRRRISVDDTSGVGASTRKIDVRSRARLQVGRGGSRIRSFSIGSRSRSACNRHPRTRHHDEVREIQDLGIAAPRFNFCKRVGAGDEENLRRGQTEAARHAEPACRRCRTAPGRAARRRSPHRPSTPFTAIAAIAKRWNGDADGRWGRCGGIVRGDDEDAVERSASRAASAASSDRGGSGSSVPPRMPMRAASFIQRSGSAVPDAWLSARSRRSRAAATSRQTASSSAGSPSPAAADTG